VAISIKNDRKKSMVPTFKSTATMSLSNHAATERTVGRRSYNEESCEMPTLGPLWSQRHIKNGL
jgi:hypothetical protein